MLLEGLSEALSIQLIVGDEIMQFDVQIPQLLSASNNA